MKFKDTVSPTYIPLLCPPTLGFLFVIADEIAASIDFFFLFSIAIFFFFYNFHCFVTMSPVSIDAHSSPLCSRFAPFRGPGRPDQRKAVLGGLQVAHAVQRGSERRQQEEGPPVFRVPGSSLCSHRFRGTAAAHRVTVGHDRRWSDCGESALVLMNGIQQTQESF